MTGPGQPLRTLFVGGPGRSGTTVVAQRIAEIDQAVAFPGVELKFFTEKNGLLDLWHSLGEHYSPNRAVVAMRQFRQFTRDLIEGRFSQPGLSGYADAAAWYVLFDTFAAALLDTGHPAPVTQADFDHAVRDLVRGLHGLALGQDGVAPDARLFVDNTPHTILEAGFLTRLLPDAAFLHVMRDPRSIARSLKAVPWGPPDIEQCCSWLDSYCRAWSRQSTAEGIDLCSVFIEDLAADPAGIGARIGAWLGTGDVGRYFAFTDPSILNGWAARADPDDLAVLNSRLAGWVDYFGYSPDAIGCRPAGPSGRLVMAPALPAEPPRSVAAET